MDGYTSPFEQDAGAHRGGGRSTKPPLITAQPYIWRDPATIPPRRWLYGRHYVRGYVSATIAPGGLGKSSLCLVEAVAMATGRSLLGVEPRRRLKVWYWNGEDPLDEIERRIAAILLHFGIDRQEIDGWLFISSGRDQPLIIAERKRDQTALNLPTIDALKRQIFDRQIDVFMADPFVSVHAVPENDNGAINLVAKSFADIAGDTASSIDLIHHVRKSGTGQIETTIEDARGAGALMGAVRSARVLNVMSIDEADKAGVTRENRRSFFRVDNGKSNMAAALDRAVWRRLVSVPLGNATDDDPQDFVGVVTPWTMPGAFDGISADDLQAAQSAIAAGEWAENVQSGNWAGYAIADALGLPSSTSTEKQRLKTLLSTWIEKGALRVEHRHDTKKGRTKPVVVVGARS